MAILIVDDDPVQCRLLEAMLQKSGYETVVLDNGDAALTLLGGADGTRIDCVILDLVMPNLDGLGVLARLRQASINVPVIVQTAHGGDDIVDAAVGGLHDHRHIDRSLPQFGEHAEPVEIRHHQIEDHGIDPLTARFAQ